MKKNLYAVLRGIASLVIAGYISFIPAFTSLAAPYNCTNNGFSIDAIGVYDLRPNGINGQTIPGTVNFSFNFDGVDPSNPPDNSDNNRIHYFFNIRIEDDGRVKLFTYCEFRSQIGSGDNGYAVYNFSYDGINYNGVLSMSPINGWGLYGEVRGNLSDFAASSGAEFNKNINSKIDDIVHAAQGLNSDGSANPEKTVAYKYNYAINGRIMKAIADAKNVTLLYTFEYEGYIFQSTITSERAAEVYSPDIPWYGPCFIACNFPTVYIGDAV